MSISVAQSTATVALLGNPNTGKSTLFNVLCGVRQRVGNYPGVTVEKKTGKMSIDGKDFTVVDLPGTYSLAPRSPDEMVTVDVLLARRGDTPAPDVVVCIVDASNIERNLFLVSQALELNLPLVVALNMSDVAEQRSIKIDRDELSKRLDVPVVELVANQRRGVNVLKSAIASASQRQVGQRKSPFSEAFQAEVKQLEEKIAATGKPWPKYLVERLLLDTGGYIESAGLPGETDAVLSEVKAARERLREAGQPVPAVEAMARYQWIGDLLKGVVQQPKEQPATFSDKVDRILTHRLWGTLIFIAIMTVIFQSIFAWAGPAMDAVELVFEWLGGIATAFLPEGMLQSLVVDGVIAGVGGVLVFLPQILILFLFIAILEDCGYMARAAYLMDRLMSRIGLSGKSFIPLLSSFACAIPGVMAARVIENRRDRLITILVAPLMSCSARLPVYTLLIAAFIPASSLVSFGGVPILGMQGVTMLAMYSIGVVTAVLVAFTLKKTILPGVTPPFVMELPGYKFPGLGTVFMRVGERGWAFVKRAGTLIFAVSILVWAASYFPRDPQVEAEVRKAHAAEIAELDERLAAVTDGEKANALEAEKEELVGEIDNLVASAYLEQSFLGRAGHLIEPVVRPLGWDWRIGCAAIASFPAREVIVGTLGVIYGLGDEEDEESDTLREQMKNATWAGTDRPVFNVPVALSIMVFFALCAQCAATLAVIKRETNSWGWPIFTFVYMTALAYVGALVTYQVGMMIGGS